MVMMIASRPSKAGISVHNARPSEPMPADIRAQLEEHYAPYDARLEALLGEPLRWANPR